MAVQYNGYKNNIVVPTLPKYNDTYVPATSGTYTPSTAYTSYPKRPYVDYSTLPKRPYNNTYNPEAYYTEAMGFLPIDTRYLVNTTNSLAYNTMADVLFNEAAWKKRYGENSVYATGPGWAQTLRTIWDTILLTKDITIDPIAQGVKEDGWSGFKRGASTALLNNLISLGNALDGLSNPIKGAIIEGFQSGGASARQGFLKGFLGDEHGRKQYDYSDYINNGVLSFGLELISDPLNLISLGSKGLISGGAKAATRGITSTLDDLLDAGLKTVDDLVDPLLDSAKYLTKDTASDLLKQMVNSSGEITKESAHRVLDNVGQGLAKSITRIGLSERPKAFTKELAEEFAQSKHTKFKAGFFERATQLSKTDQKFISEYLQRSVTDLPDLFATGLNARLKIGSSAYRTINNVERALRYAGGATGLDLLIPAYSGAKHLGGVLNNKWLEYKKDLIIKTVDDLQKELRFIDAELDEVDFNDTLKTVLSDSEIKTHTNAFKNLSNIKDALLKTIAKHGNSTTMTQLEAAQRRMSTVVEKIIKKAGLEGVSNLDDYINYFKNLGDAVDFTEQIEGLNILKRMLSEDLTNKAVFERYKLSGAALTEMLSKQLNASQNESMLRGDKLVKEWRATAAKGSKLAKKLSKNTAAINKAVSNIVKTTSLEDLDNIVTYARKALSDNKNGHSRLDALYNTFQEALNEYDRYADNIEPEYLDLVGEWVPDVQSAMENLAIAYQDLVKHLKNDARFPEFNINTATEPKVTNAFGARPLGVDDVVSLGAKEVPSKRYLTADTHKLYNPMDDIRNDVEYIEDDFIRYEAGPGITTRDLTKMINDLPEYDITRTYDIVNPLDYSKYKLITYSIMNSKTNLLNELLGINTKGESVTADITQSPMGYMLKEYSNRDSELYLFLNHPENFDVPDFEIKNNIIPMRELLERMQGYKAIVQKLNTFLQAKALPDVFQQAFLDQLVTQLSNKRLITLDNLSTVVEDIMTGADLFLKHRLDTKAVSMDALLHEVITAITNKPARYFDTTLLDAKIKVMPIKANLAAGAAHEGMTDVNHWIALMDLADASDIKLVKGVKRNLLDTANGRYIIVFDMETVGTKEATNVPFQISGKILDANGKVVEDSAFNFIIPPPKGIRPLPTVLEKLSKGSSSTPLEWWETNIINAVNDPLTNTRVFKNVDEARAEFYKICTQFGEDNFILAGQNIRNFDIALLSKNASPNVQTFFRNLNTSNRVFDSVEYFNLRNVFQLQGVNRDWFKLQLTSLLKEALNNNPLVFTRPLFNYGDIENLKQFKELTTKVNLFNNTTPSFNTAALTESIELSRTLSDVEQVLDKFRKLKYKDSTNIITVIKRNLPKLIPTLEKAVELFHNYKHPLAADLENILYSFNKLYLVSDLHKSYKARNILITLYDGVNTTGFKDGPRVKLKNISNTSKAIDVLYKLDTLIPDINEIDLLKTMYPDCTEAIDTVKEVYNTLMDTPVDKLTTKQLLTSFTTIYNNIETVYKRFQPDWKDTVDNFYKAVNTLSKESESFLKDLTSLSGDDFSIPDYNFQKEVIEEVLGYTYDTDAEGNVVKALNTDTGFNTNVVDAFNVTGTIDNIVQMWRSPSKFKGQAYFTVTKLDPNSFEKAVQNRLTQLAKDGLIDVVPGQNIMHYFMNNVADDKIIINPRRSMSYEVEDIFDLKEALDKFKVEGQPNRLTVRDMERMTRQMIGIKNIRNCLTLKVVQTLEENARKFLNDLKDKPGYAKVLRSDLDNTSVVAAAFYYYGKLDEKDVLSAIPEYKIFADLSEAFKHYDNGTPILHSHKNIDPVTKLPRFMYEDDYYSYVQLADALRYNEIDALNKYNIDRNLYNITEAAEHKLYSDYKELAQAVEDYLNSKGKLRSEVERSLKKYYDYADERAVTNILTRSDRVNVLKSEAKTRASRIIFTTKDNIDLSDFKKDTDFIVRDNLLLEDGRYAHAILIKTSAYEQVDMINFKPTFINNIPDIDETGADFLKQNIARNAAYVNNVGLSHGDVLSKERLIELDAVLKEKGWFTEDELAQIPDVDILIANKYFNSLNANNSVIGDYAFYKELFGEDVSYIADPFKQTFYNLQGVVKNQSTRLKSFLNLSLNEHSSINSELFGRLRPEDALELFKNNSDVGLYVLKRSSIKNTFYSDMTESGVILEELKIVNLKSIELAKELNAYVLPRTHARQLMQNINTFELPYMARLARDISSTFKIAYMTSLGFLIRNLIDSNYKTRVAFDREISLPAQVKHLFSTMKLLRRYDEIGKTYSSILNKYFSTDLDYKTFYTVCKNIDLDEDAIIKEATKGLSDRLTKKTATHVKQILTKVEDKQILKELQSKLIEPDLFSVIDAFNNYGPSTGLVKAVQNNIPSMNKINEKLTFVGRANNFITEKTPIRWVFDGNEMIERAARTSMFLQDLQRGSDINTATKNIIRTHFDYSDKSLKMIYLEIVFPFMSFSYKNLEFWLDSIVKNPLLVGELENIFRPILNYHSLFTPDQEAYEAYDYTFDWSEDVFSFKANAPWAMINAARLYHILNGNIVIDTGKDVEHDNGYGTKTNDLYAVFKLSPSVLDAVKMLYSPLNSYSERLLPPYETLLNIFTGLGDGKNIKEQLSLATLANMLPYADVITQRLGLDQNALQDNKLILKHNNLLQRVKDGGLLMAIPSMFGLAYVTQKDKMYFYDSNYNVLGGFKSNYYAKRKYANPYKSAYRTQPKKNYTKSYYNPHSDQSSEINYPQYTISRLNRKTHSSRPKDIYVPSKTNRAYVQQYNSLIKKVSDKILRYRLKDYKHYY